MRIGEVADAVGTPAQTIRFYERKGLLSPPRRDPNGYRDYDTSVLTRLDFIRSGQSAGLTLVEIASILDVRRDGAAPCTHVHSLLLTKLDAVRARQRELAVLEGELEGLISRSDRLDPADCTDVQICHIITASDPAYCGQHGAIQASDQGATMSDKSPRQGMTKKSGKSIKEKRAEKRAKGHEEPASLHLHAKKR